MNPKTMGLIIAVLSSCAAPNPTTVTTHRQVTPHEKSVAWATRHLPGASVTDVRPTSRTTWDAKLDGTTVHFEDTPNRGTTVHLHVPIYTPTEGYR